MDDQTDFKSQVKLQLTTRHSDISLPDNTGPILVNTNLRRYALSTLVNHLLESEKPIPFEFLINGTFLRTSIDEYLTANGISSETLLIVEYVRAIIPPTHVASFEHDDWVSAVDVLSKTSRAGKWAGEGVAPMSGQERILSGSYDGFVRVWNASSEVLATSATGNLGGHIGAVKATKWVTPHQIASSGYDRTIRIWKYEEDSQTFKAAIVPQIELYGHKASVNAIDVNAPSARVLSASDDHTVGMWSTKKSGAPAAPDSMIPPTTGRNSKRRKVSTTTSTPQKGPLSLLRGHSAPVTATIFAPNDSTVAYSTSLDHTLRTWDLPTASLVDTRTTSHSLLSVVALPDLNLVGVGTSARHVTLIDPRVSATTVSAMTLRGHSNAVVALVRDPNSTYGLLSGSHDGTCRIWDVRSSRSDSEGVVSECIYTLTRESAKGEGRRVGGEGVKVFGICWDQEIGIISGGEDKRVQINRGSGVMPQG